MAHKRGDMLRQRMKVRIASIIVSAALALGLSATNVTGQTAIDADAGQVLQGMSSYLGHLAAFTVDFDVDTEVVDLQGQKLQASRSGHIAVVRPNHLYGTRTGGGADAELYFDGQTVTLYGKTRNIYVQEAHPGTIDDMLDALRAMGADLAGADLLYADPAPGLLTNVERGADYGTVVVGGVPCEHLAFRARDVDWQVWIAKGNQPFPMKYVITSKWVVGAPQYVVRMSHWNVQAQIDPKQFVFTPPAGAMRFTKIEVNGIGELTGGSAVFPGARDVQAIVGMPLTPVSYAGVARRTVR
jgi:hypothetical protein